MSPRNAFATGRRVLTQLRRDPRTIALLVVVPCVLMILVRYLLAPPVFDRLGASALGLFPFVVMFAVTAITTLHERTSGTLERLFTMPVIKLDLLVGYAITFGVAALAQAGALGWLTLGPLGLDIAGSTALLMMVAVIDGVLGMALGLGVSALATTEYQAAQLMPAFVLPQVLLFGIFGPRAAMALPPALAVGRVPPDVFRGRDAAPERP